MIRLLTSAMEHWRHYVRHRQIMNAANQHARNHHHITLSRTMFTLWRFNLALKHQNQVRVFFHKFAAVRLSMNFRFRKRR